MYKHKRRGSIAQSIVETVVGIIFLVPIVLFLFDIAVLVLANTANDNLAKNAARAAASATVSGSTDGSGSASIAGTAAQGIIANFATSGIIPVVQMQSLNWQGQSPGTAGPGPHNNNPNPGPGLVSVVIRMDIQPPVPFPGVDRKTYYARAVEPIVSEPPQ